MKKVYEPKILKPGNVILAKVENLNHLLKRRDRESVQKVRDFLAAKDIDTYLTGGVIDSAIFSGSKHYGDVDLLGVFKEDKKPDFNSIKKDLGSGEFIRIKGLDFVASDLHNQIAYCGFPVDARYILCPENYLGIIERANIDLSFISEERFNAGNYFTARQFPSIYS